MSRAVRVVCGALLLPGCASLPVSGRTDPAASAAEVRQLEERWTRAFNERDARFMEQTMAPEFVLSNFGPGQAASFTRRADWMRVWLGPSRLPYESKVINVVVAGDTAVALLEASWRRNSFLTDTWSRRGGRWQLISRHSTAR